MSGYRISRPGGIVPRFAPRQLPGESAQVAANLSVLPGEWRPMRKPKFLWSPSSAQAVLSFYRVDDSTWLAWPIANVNMERAALEGEARLVYTGDGVPKITVKSIATPVGPTGAPVLARTLGIPAPQSTPTLSHAGGTGATVTRFYAYTFFSDWGEESAPSPVSSVVTGKVDGAWSFGNMDVSPPNSSGITGVSYAPGVVTLTLGTGNHYARARDQYTISGVVGMTDLNGSWAIASVPAANQITISLTTGQTYTSGGVCARTNPWGACTKRIYRTAGTRADFQLVVANIASGTTSYSDTLLDANILGDSLLSQTWVPPPTNMVGLVSMPGGVFAGFIEGGRTVCFCEPYQPHAWPTGYQKKVSDDIVGMAVFDTNLGVATKGMPVVISGYDPAQMSVTRHAKPFPCLSRASVCSVSDSVIFASKNGLARTDLSGTSIFSEEFFTPEGWNALTPASVHCASDGVQLYIYCSPRKLLFIQNISEGGAMVNAYQQVDAMRAEVSTGDLFFAFAKAIYRLNSFDAAPQIMDWFSKEYLLPKPENLSFAKIDFDETYSAEAVIAIAAERAAVIASNQAVMSSPMGGRGGLNGRVVSSLRINGSVLASVPVAQVGISLTLYANGKFVCSKSVLDQNVFRLDNGYKADNFSVRIQANTQIRSITVADSVRALGQA